MLKEQYKDGANLDARIALHARFSTATQNFHDWLFDHIDVPPDARLLELGCGTGQLWKMVGARVPPTWRLTLTDFSFGMVSGIRDLVETRSSRARALRGASQSECPVSRPVGRGAQSAPHRMTAQDIGASLQSDAQAIPFPDETFDAVIANHMLYHVPDLPRALAEIRRALKTGGALYAATNGAEHMAELFEFSEALGVDYSYAGSLSFRLENGAALLSPYFTSVERDDFDDALFVTEAEPLIAYMLSMRAAMHGVSDEQVQQLRALVNERIARDGVIRIRKETGLFIART